MPRYVDRSGRIRWTRIVYVIELKKEACADRRSPCEGTRCGRTPVYVGETGHTAQERFEQHKRGYKASRWPRRYGWRLRPGLTSDVGEFATSDEAEAAEAALAHSLGSSGGGKDYCVNVGPRRKARA